MSRSRSHHRGRPGASISSAKLFSDNFCSNQSITVISELGLPELLPLGLQLDELSLFGSEAEEGGEDLLRGLECVPVALRYHGDVVILHVLV